MKTHVSLLTLAACQAGCVAVDDLTPDTLARTASGRYLLAAHVEGFGAEPTSVTAAIGRVEFPLTHVGRGRWETDALLGACAQGFELRYLVRYPTVGSTLATAVEPPGATTTSGGFLKWVMPEPKPLSCTRGPSVFRVNTFSSDAIDANPGDGICDTTAGAPVECTIAAAIVEGNRAPGPVTIELPAGTHTPHISFYPSQDMVFQGLEPGVVINQHISTSSSATLEFRNVTLRRGVASLGAGSLRLTNVSVLNNSGDFVEEGVSARGRLFIEQSTIRGNRRVGIKLFPGARAQIVDSLIADNGATGAAHAGGVWCLHTSASTGSTELTLTSSTITGNSGSTGGVWLGAGCNATLKNVTIAGNTVPAVSATLLPSAGGLTATAGSSVRLANTIVADNVNGNDPTLANCSTTALTGTVTLESLGHNLIGSLGSCVLDPLLDRPNLIGVSALLGELADHGGPTQTRLPLADSLALGAGSADPLNDASDAACTHTDQRGQARSVPCDIGAVQTSP